VRLAGVEQARRNSVGRLKIVRMIFLKSEFRLKLAGGLRWLRAFSDGRNNFFDTSILDVDVESF